jgi:O-antigen ligase
VFIISLTGYYVYSSPFFHRLEVMVELQNVGSTEQRIYLFKTAVDVWLENWESFFFGIGHDNFRDLNILRTYSHSTISEVLVSSGLVGFLLYFCALGVLFKNLYIQRKRLSESKHFTTIFSCFIFFILIVFFNATAVLYSGRELWPLIGCISSYVMFLKRLA